jgi:adenine-specific DNA-methyltransferase
VLIDCDLPEEELREKYPGFWDYLEIGKRRGIPDGYLASRRSPWYSQERRAPPPFLCTYMGRGANGRKPFRFIWNQSAAVATNLYLLLYPKRLLRAALAANPKAHAKVYRALREIDADNLIGQGRVYGGGLYKLEPKELGRIPAGGVVAAVPLPPSVRQADLFAER